MQDNDILRLGFVIFIVAATIGICLLAMIEVDLMDIKKCLEKDKSDATKP